MRQTHAPWRKSASLAVALLVGAAACEDAPSSDQPPRSASTPEESAQQAKGEGAGEDEAPRPSRSAPAPAAEQGPPPPELGCRPVGHVSLGTNLGAGRVAVRDDGYWVAAYGRRQGKRSLERLHVDRDLKVRPLPSLPLGKAGESTARVPPAIAAGRSLWVAALDSKGALELWPDADADAPQAVELATRVDHRFAPALRLLDDRRALVAYTEGDATGMRVHAVTVAGESRTRHALTPLGHGASAPRFVLGAENASLLMIDARSGMSPLLRVDFDASGTPGQAKVERPVNLPYSPPALVALTLPKATPHVAYTAVGNGATAAVGLVPLGRADPPVAVLKGSGYALLSVDAALGPARAVFAVDAPLHSEPDPPLEVQLRVWDGSRFGEALHLPGEEGTRQRPAVAYDAARDRVVLVSLHGTSLELHTLRCDL